MPRLFDRIGVDINQKLALEPAVGVGREAQGALHRSVPGPDARAAAEIEAELRDSRRVIEAKLARPAEFFSYPNGDVDERTLAGVRRYYRAAVRKSVRAAVRYNSVTGSDLHLMPCMHLPSGVLALAWRVNQQGAAAAALPGAH